MRNLLILMLLALVPASFTSCRHGRTGPAGEPGQNGIGQDGTDGQDGQDGGDGANGNNGLNGMGFDYVRGMDGATICDSALVINASEIIPADILRFAPAEDTYDADGLTLTFGIVGAPFRCYLGAVSAGEYCVVEKVHGEGWVAVGDPLVFDEDGWVAIVPPDMIPYLGPLAFDRARVLEFYGECNVLDYSSHRLQIGKDIRINFRRD